MNFLLRCCNSQAHTQAEPFVDFTWEGPPSPKACPVCNNSIALFPRVRIFFIVPHPEGPIYGLHGMRFFCPSDPKRSGITEHVEALTGEWRAVTNPDCMKTKEYRKAKAADELRQAIRSGNILPDIDYDALKETTSISVADASPKNNPAAV